jgi:hypothetical protein
MRNRCFLVVLGSAILLSIVAAPLLPALAAPPTPGTAFTAVKLDGVRLGTDHGQLRTLTPTIIFVAGVYHMWVLVSDTTLALTQIVHATSTDGVNFTSTGTLSYAGGNPFAGTGPDIVYGADEEVPVIFPKAARFGANHKLLLWTPFDGTAIGSTWGDYTYNSSINDLGGSPSTLAVTHQGPIGAVPANGIAGQSNGPWGIVNDVFYYENNGKLGRAPLTDNGPQTFPTTQWTGPWQFTGTNTPVKDLVNTIPGFSYCGIIDGDPQVYPRNHGAAIDNLDGTLGVFYTLRDCFTDARVTKQIYYVESADNGLTWSDPVGIFPDGSLVTVDGAANTDNFSDPEIVQTGSTRVVYFNTKDAAGNFVVVTNAHLTCFGLPATIIGTEGNDRLTGTSGPDIIVGLGGNDLIKGLGGADVICGGDGDDVIEGGDGADLIDGGAGDDLIKGQNGDDALLGGDDDDIIEGGAGTDFLDGGPGTDTLKGQAGTDTCVNGETVATCE